MAGERAVKGAARLAFMRRLAWLALFWESAVRVAWRPLCWAGLFAGLWLLQIPAMLGEVAEIFIALLFAAGFIALTMRGLGGEKLPDNASIDRRLERDSRLVHRPLDHLADHMAVRESPLSSLLWLRSRDEANAALEKLRPPRPRPQLAGRDGTALRIAILLFVLLAALAAGPQAAQRLTRGLLPFTLPTGGPAAPDDALIVWITPPGYTHQPRLTLTGEGRWPKALALPAGSVIRARLRGGFFRPVLTLGKTRTTLQRLNDGTGGDRIWNARMNATPGERLRLWQGPVLRLSVPVRYVTDQPPQITLKALPQALPKGGLQFDVSVRDDYGVTGLLVAVRADPDQPSPPLGAPQTFIRSVMSAPGRETELKPVFDLTGHPWAGHAVLLDIAARDGGGHVTRLAPIRITLPERSFANPAARRVVNLRKQLIAAPLAAPVDIASQLEDVMVHIGLYNGDPITFLTLRSAASRLLWNRTLPAVASVVDELWQAALRMEDGNLSLTAQSLRDAQDALQALLDNPDSTPQQIAAAMDNVRAAMGQYLQQLYYNLVQQAAQRGEKPPQPEDFTRQIGADQLSAFLDQLQAKAMAGDRDAARSMLAQLQQLSDKLDPANAGGGLSPRAQAMLKSLQGMNEILAGERQLQAQTRQAKIVHAPTASQTATQEALRHKLGGLMAEQDGPIPPSMQKAEQAMRGASGALSANQADPALANEQTALDQLQQSAQGMAQQLQQMITLLAGPTDPLGHPLDNGNSLLGNSDIKLPDQDERRQVQDIMRLLRERAGQLNRPDYELDYYRRLMQQY